MKRFIGLMAALFILLAAAYALAASRGWMTEDAVSEWIRQVRGSSGGRAAAALLVIGLLSADLVLPVPSSVVMTLSGAFLGWGAGTAASALGGVASALAGFGLCRAFGQRAFERLVGPADLARVERVVERYGAWGILFSRSVPMLTEVASCMAGLSRMRFRVFLALVLAGTLPLCAVYAWAGSRGARSGMAWAVLLAFAIPAIGFAWLRHASAQKPGPP